MSLSRSIALLFAMNTVDAFVTLIWIRYGVTTEGNFLMATVLEYGELPFLAIKLGMGVITVAVLLYGAQYRLAVIGARVGLVVYSIAIVSHVLTGFAAKGYLS